MKLNLRLLLGLTGGGAITGLILGGPQLAPVSAFAGCLSALVLIFCRTAFSRLHCTAINWLMAKGWLPVAGVAIVVASSAVTMSLVMGALGTVFFGANFDAAGNIVFDWGRLRDGLTTGAKLGAGFGSCIGMIISVVLLAICLVGKKSRPQ